MSRQLSTEGFDATLPEEFDNDTDWRCYLIAKLGTDDSKTIAKAIDDRRKKTEEIILKERSWKKD